MLTLIDILWIVLQSFGLIEGKLFKYSTKTLEAIEFSYSQNHLNLEKIIIFLELNFSPSSYFSFSIHFNINLFGLNKEVFHAQKTFYSAHRMFLSPFVSSDVSKQHELFLCRLFTSNELKVFENAN